jgi:hypothetical protein
VQIVVVVERVTGAAILHCGMMIGVEAFQYSVVLLPATVKVTPGVPFACAVCEIPSSLPSPTISPLAVLQAVRVPVASQQSTVVVIDLPVFTAAPVA